MRMFGAQGVEEAEGVGQNPAGVQASPHISLRDVPDVIHVFDVALVLHSSNSDGFFTHFGGDILLDFDAQFFEDQVPCRGSGDIKFIRVVFPEPRPSSDFKPSPELRPDPARTWSSSREPMQMAKKPHPGFTRLPGWRSFMKKIHG